MTIQEHFPVQNNHHLCSVQDFNTLQYRTDDYNRLSVLFETERVVNQRNESDKLNPSHNHILRSSKKKNKDLVRLTYIITLGVQKKLRGLKCL